MKLTYEQANELKIKLLTLKGSKINFPDNQQIPLTGILREPYNSKEAQEYGEMKGVDEDYVLSNYSELTLKFVSETKLLHTTSCKEMSLEEFIQHNVSIWNKFKP